MMLYRLLDRADAGQSARRRHDRQILAGLTSRHHARGALFVIAHRTQNILLPHLARLLRLMALPLVSRTSAPTRSPHYSPPPRADSPRRAMATSNA